MQAIGQLYNTFRDALAGPMMTALVFLYHSLGSVGIPSWGLTIIVFTVLVKVVFWPLTLQQIRSSRAMQALQPQLNELKKTHGKDKEKMMQEQMRLYRENRVNPMAGCLPMLIQLPIWIGLYQALFELAAQPDFASRFLWIPNLAKPEGFPYILAILSGASQFVVQRMMQVQSTDAQQQTMNQAMQFMPIMYIFIAFSMPAGLVLYWVASNVFTLVQQSFIYGWGSVLPWRQAPALAVTSGRVPPREMSVPAESESVGSGASTRPASAAPRRPKKRRK